MSEPTVIDSLIVTLGLDPADFDKGRKKAAADFVSMKGDAAAAAKEMQARGKQAAEFYGSIKKEALGLFAVVTGAGGLERFTRETVTNFSLMGRAAQAMGLSTSQLGAFQNMIIRNGGSADAARASLQALARSMQEWKVLGNTAALPYLNRVGANANDSALQVYEKFSRFAPTVDKKTANLIGQGLGLDEASINQAMRGQAEFQRQMQLSYKMGVPSDDDVRKVTQLQRAFLELRQTLTGDAQSMLEDVAPALSGLIGLADRGAQAFPGFTKAIIAFGVAVGGLSALKFMGGVLSLLTGGKAAATVAAAAGGAESAGVGAGIDALVAGGGAAAATAGGVALAAPALAAAAAGYELFHPTAANAGESARLDRARKRMGMGSVADMAAARALRPGAPGYDHDLAIRTLIGEARPGDFQGMKDVAHVIKNRMSATGKGAADIVLQKGQFEPWGTDASRKRLLGISKDSAAYKMAQKAWWDSVNEADPTGGATMFVSPGGQAAKGRNMPPWYDPSQVTLARGGHMFQRGAFPGMNSRTVQIGSVTIQTQATDAKGIAQDFGKELERQNLANQVNTGLF